MDTFLECEKLTCSFLLAANRVEWKQARAIRRCRIVVVTQLRFDYDTTTIPRRIRLYDGIDRNYDMRSIRLRYDNDSTATYGARLLPFDASKNEHVNFSS